MSENKYTLKGSVCMWVNQNLIMCAIVATICQFVGISVILICTLI